MNIQRYSLVDESDEDVVTSHMEMDLEGDYVEYDDAMQAICKLEGDVAKLRSALLAIVGPLDDDKFGYRCAHNILIDDIRNDARDALKETE